MINPFRIRTKYQCLLQKYVDLQVENERLTIQNRKLLARSERFRLAAISTEKQKGALQLKIKELEESHDGCHRRNQEQRIKELEESEAKLLKERYEDANRKRTWDYE